MNTGSIKNPKDHFISMPRPAVIPKTTDHFLSLKPSVFNREYTPKVTIEVRAKSR
jgi:hypothetical protein